MQRIGIIGFGNMGSSIARGLRAEDEGLRLGVIEPNGAARQQAVSELGATDYTDDPERCFTESDVIILAIKPQDLDDAAERLRSYSAGAPVISVLAGTPIRRVADLLGTEQVARFMPSLAASVGRSLVGVAFSPEADSTLRQNAFKAANAIGTPLEVPEHLMAAVTGVSGSGLAYAFTFAHALAMGGVATGLKYDDALHAAIAVLDGASAVLKSTGQHPQVLTSRVSSPGGTTIRGLTALERGAFTATVIDAVREAAARASELEG